MLKLLEVDLNLWFLILKALIRYLLTSLNDWELQLQKWQKIGIANVVEHNIYGNPNSCKFHLQVALIEHVELEMQYFLWKKCRIYAYSFLYIKSFFKGKGWVRCNLQISVFGWFLTLSYFKSESLLMNLKINVQGAWIHNKSKLVFTLYFRFLMYCYKCYEIIQCITSIEFYIILLLKFEIENI